VAVGRIHGALDGCSSIGRAPDSKSGGWGFKSLRPCFVHDRRIEMAKHKTTAAKSAGLRSAVANTFAVGRYKRAQGRVTRQLTAAAVSLIVFFGSYTLYQKLLTELSATDGMKWLPLWSATAVTVLGLWATFRIIHWPRFADFLISVEAEMDKVTWSDWGELKRSTAVVLITMVVLTLVLFLFDVFWQKIFTSTGVLF
jgi:preprotein translocase subunit SecE